MMLNRRHLFAVSVNDASLVMPYCAGTGAISSTKESTYIKFAVSKIMLLLRCLIAQAQAPFLSEREHLYKNHSSTLVLFHDHNMFSLFEWVSGIEVEICVGLRYIWRW